MENKLHFDDVRLVLDQNAQFMFFPPHRNHIPWVDMSLHPDTLFYFQTNQSFLFLLNAIEKQRYQFHSFWIGLTVPQILDLPHSSRPR